MLRFLQQWAPMARTINPESMNVLQQARTEMGFTLEEVADSVGSNGASISRIERAKQMGRRELYRALHKFYGGVISLGEIYDPQYDARPLDSPRAKRLTRLAKRYRSEGFPSLA